MPSPEEATLVSSASSFSSFDEIGGSDRFEDLDLGLEDVTARWKCHQHRVLEVLGTDADDHAAAAAAVARLHTPAQLPCEAQVPDRCPQLIAIELAR